jgi:hypothetical protein
MNESTGAAIDSASLQRWLAEAPWYPAALGAQSPVTWEPIDERSARATVTAGSTGVSGTFHFAEDDGRIERFETRRARDLGKGRTTEALWTARYDRWELRSEMRVPTEGRVCWEVGGDGDEFDAGRVRVAELQYGVPMRYVTFG